MLQAIHDTYNSHHIHNSAANLTTTTPASSLDDGKAYLLLAGSGSVTVIKIPEIAKALSRYKDKLSIRIILIQSAKHFLARQSEEQPIVSRH